MAIRDHYVVLGVPRTETMPAIRAAYRDLARRFHPDRIGAEGNRVLQEINEAYEVLSDPRKRHAYNDELHLDEPVYRPRAEPMIPEPFRPGWMSIFEHPDSVRPSFDSLHERFHRNFIHAGIPKSERLEALDLDLVLSPEEAARGVLLRLGVPVWEGGIEQEATVPLRVPPRVPEGSLFEVPLTGLGIRNVCLRLHVSIDA
jgi:molecular chaperone DnaJ